MLIQQYKFQTYLLPHVVDLLQNKTGNKVEIRKVEARFFKRIRLYDVYIEDFNKDTLIFSKLIEVKFKTINLDHKEIQLNNVLFTEAYVNLLDLDEKGLNLKFFIECFKKQEKKEGKPLTISSKKLEFINSRFSYQNKTDVKENEILDFGNLDFKNLNIKTEEFQIIKGKVKFDIKDMSFNDRSGFTFNHFIARTDISDSGIIFNDPYIETKHSILIGKRIALLLNSFQDFKNKGIINKVKLDVLLEPSNINFLDIAHFTPKFKNYDQNFIFSGHAKGPVNALKGNDIEVKIGNSSVLSCNIYFNGLPETNKTYVYADIKNLSTNSSDLESLKKFGGNEEYINVPEIITKLGNLRYVGIYTGFFNDFNSYGTVFSDMGIFNTDIFLKPDSVKILTLSGKVTGENFNGGKLLNIKNLGNASFTTDLYAKLKSDSGFVANFSSYFSKLSYNQYNYSNIKSEVNIHSDNISGSFNINDPNLNAEIIGDLQHLRSVPEIKIRTDIKEVALANINILDSAYQVSLHMNADLKGKTINDISGYINLKNIGIINKKDSLKIESVDVNVLQSNDNSVFELNSEIFDARISGKVGLSHLVPAYKNIIYKYISNLNKSDDSLIFFDSTMFEYLVNIKNIQPTLNFFVPNISVSENTSLFGLYNASINKYEIDFFSNYIVFNDFVVKGMQFSTRSDDTLLSINSGCEYVMVKQLQLENFSIYADLYKNQTDLNIRWNNWDSILYKGNIKAKAIFEDKTETENIKVHLYASDINIHDTLWNLNEGDILLDSNFIGFRDIMMNNNEQSVSLKGAISKIPEDTLYIDFKNFDLNNLNLLFSQSKTKIGGKLNCNISLSDIYKDRFFISNFEARQLLLNEVSYGDYEGQSVWDVEKKQILFKINALKGEEAPVKVNGYVEPVNKDIYAEIELDKVRLKSLQPYLSSVTSNLTGRVSGNIILKGKTREPILNGYLNLKHTIIQIDYLGTSYLFEDKVKIKDNRFMLDNIVLYDKYGKKARLNGEVKNNYLKDFALDLHIKPTNFLLLETTVYDNPDFYGNAYGTGNIDISGPLKLLNFDIDIKTEPNTEFNVPLTSDVTVSDISFIEYYPKQAKTKDELYLLNRKATKRTTSNLLINFDLEVTPDAQIQLIFDSKLGDIIKGRGKGKLKMEVNSSGKFLMYGEIEVVEGDYLFTAQNIINKKFKVKGGGTIEWNGNPEQAILNIEAVYPLRTSIAPLFPSYGSNDSRYNKVLPVECQLFMQDNLMNPTTKLGINLPNASEEIKGMVNNILSSEEEISKQFVSLMLINQFIKPSGSTDIVTDVASNIETLNVATFELVSNQLSHMLSQLNEDLNIFIDYYNDPEQSRKELEIMLSYKVINDRVTISSEIDVPTQQDEQNPNNKSNLIGDFDVDVKLTDNGKLRFKAYNREHTEVTDLEPYYTQGIGFFFREEFNSFGELLKGYYNRIFHRKEEEE